MDYIRVEPPQGWRDFPCPKCKQPPGYPCKEWDGREPSTGPHSSRVRKANGYARRMAKKRGYSGEFPSTREKRVYFMLDKIPPALWIRVKAKAKREGVSLRALILGWCKEWVEK
jgi:hypothetical protein